jgi:hypothetical protein
MKIAVMQPYFFPYIGYFQCIHAVDTYILFDNLNFIKKKWVHRNRILINGQPNYLMVNIAQKSSYKKIREITLIDDTFWRKKNLKKIFLSYKSASYFDEIYPLIESMMLYDSQSLAEFNANLIQQICSALEINTRIIPNSTPYDFIEEKLANPSSLDVYKQQYQLNDYSLKVVRILELCMFEKASTFVNAIGGQTLYKIDEFKKNGIDLLFVNTHDYAYQQHSTIFHPHLSIIDVLFHCGIEGTKKMIPNYSLI